MSDVGRSGTSMAGDLRKVSSLAENLWCDSPRTHGSVGSERPEVILFSPEHSTRRGVSGVTRVGAKAASTRDEEEARRHRRGGIDAPPFGPKGSLLEPL